MQPVQHRVDETDCALVLRQPLIVDQGNHTREQRGAVAGAGRLREVVPDLRQLTAQVHPYLAKLPALAQLSRLRVELGRGLGFLAYGREYDRDILRGERHVRVRAIRRVEK